MRWHGALQAKRKRSLENRGQPIAWWVNPETARPEIVWDGIPKEVWDPDSGITRIVWRRPKQRSQKPSGRPPVRDVEAIKRCLAALSQGNPVSHVRYSAYTRTWYTPGTRAWYPRIQHTRTVTRNNDRINMHRHVKKWWPICARAYQGENEDLL